MSTSLLIACTLLAASADLTPGQVLQYRGELAPEKEAAGVVPARFELNFVILDAAASGTQVGWVLQEEGRPGWGWSDRFGIFRLNENLGPIKSSGGLPTLLFRHATGEGIARFSLPWVWHDQPLLAGDSWTDGKFTFTVGERVKTRRGDGVEVAVRNANSRRRTLVLPPDAVVADALDEIVFLGQGHEHHLQLALAGVTPLADDQLAQVKKSLTDWDALRNRIGWTPETPGVTWSAAQRETLRDAIPRLKQEAAGTLMAEVAQAAADDVQQQGDTAGAVAELQKRHVGQPAPKLDLPGLVGAKLGPDDLADHVTVLHFWEYRDAPLEEPYGQVGYLDFLWRKYKDNGVQMFGVSVDKRLADAGTRRAGETAARKLKEFMNLGYPVLLDGGAAIKQFGDPRQAGAELPLFVVIGRDGKVVHYHVGLHEVDRDTGLKELDAAITAALQSGR